MPEISLKAYFGKLNSLLSINAADEVIHHSRHILQSYPKNVTAYRYLGRALVLNGRWDEGRETLRRVLTVYPDDYIAHLGLSEANEHLNRPDEAIWHLERAYEQNPNNKEIIDALRSLYRRYRNVDNLKIQLTAAAVARQNLRSGNYTQAIDTLRSARARMNDRLDLKLLLAQILWDQGSEEEAAEIAVDVLKVLPDCLEANKIMAKLWLTMGRPSDAQRYVNHLENVDPYIAVEVVEGTAPDDDVFRLDELDYVRTAASEMASARPDWLQEISATAAPAGAAAASNGEQDDWSSWTSVLLGNQTHEPEQPAPTLGEIEEAPMSSRFATMQENEPPRSVETIRTEGLTDLFGAVDAAPADELASLFETPLDDASDPMAWMRDAGIETLDEEDEEPSFESLFAADAADNSPLPEMDANPMAWLENANSDLILEDDAPAPLQADDDEPVFGWMQDEVSNSAGASDSWDEPTPASAFGATGESLDWLQDDHLLDEALSLEGHLSEDRGTAQREAAFSAFSAEILDGRDDMLDQEQAFEWESEEPAAPGALRGLTAMLQEIDFDKLQEQEAAGGVDEMDEWLNQFGPAQPRPVVTDTPDWLTDLEQPETDTVEEDEEDDWLPTGAAAVLGMAAVDTFAMNSEQPGGEGDNPDELYDDDDADWLAEFAPEDETGGESEFEATAGGDEPDWLRGGLSAEAPAAMQDADTGALPDWLNDYVPGASGEDAETPPKPAVPIGEIDWGASITPVTEEETALSDWLSEVESGGAEDADGDVELEASADAEYTWLSDSAEEAEPVGQEEVDWLAELEPNANEPAAAVAVEAGAEAEQLVDTGELPGWLAELESAAAQEQAVAEDEYTWMRGDGSDAADAEMSEAAASEEMDWLAEFAPEAGEAEPAAETVDTVAVAEEEADWLSALGEAADDEGGVVAETVAVASEEMDWLAELAPAELTPEGDGAFHPTEDDAAVASSEVPLAAAGVGVADWLAELGEAAEDESTDEDEAEAVPVASEEMEWLAALEPDAEAAASTAEDYPWMNTDSETGVPTEIAAAEVSMAAGEDEAWLTDLEVATSETGAPTEIAAAEVSMAVGDDEDAWLTELEAATSETELAGEPIAEEDLSWLAADEVSDSELEEALQPAADEDMGWLSELEPEGVAAAAAVAAAVSSTGTEVPGDEDDLSWLPADELEEEPEAEPVAEADAVTESDAEEAAFDSEPGEDEEALEPTPAINAPDWLNAMVPGLDVDYEAAEDDWTEDEEAAFDASEREYAWVEQMVEEEMGEVAYAGYSFSHPPAWLSSRGSPSQSPAPDDDLPDWISDDTDADVPSWLR